MNRVSVSPLLAMIVFDNSYLSPQVPPEVLTIVEVPEMLSVTMAMPVGPLHEDETMVKGLLLTSTSQSLQLKPNSLVSVGSLVNIYFRVSDDTLTILDSELTPEFPLSSRSIKANRFSPLTLMIRGSRYIFTKSRGWKMIGGGTKYPRSEERRV